MNKFIFYILICLLSLGTLQTTSAVEDTAINQDSERLKRLTSFLTQNQKYSLNFKQKNYSTTTGQQVDGNGVLSIDTADKFEWIYTTKPHNSIVCDGKYIVMITPDSEQIMIEKATTLKSIWSPISLLTTSPLEDRFHVKSVESTEDYSILRLSPKNSNDEQPPFDYVLLTIPHNFDSLVFKLLIIEGSGSTNELAFSKFQILDSTFSIKIPSFPPNYDLTDFQGNPKNRQNFSKEL